MVSPALYNGTLAFSGMFAPWSHPFLIDLRWLDVHTGCNPGRPVSLINSHGEVDKTIPYVGRNDTSGAYVSVTTIFSFSALCPLCCASFLSHGSSPRLSLVLPYSLYASLLADETEICRV